MMIRLEIKLTEKIDINREAAENIGTINWKS